MKKVTRILLILTSACTTAYGQSAVWQPQGATTGSIYYSGGNVGIGTTSPVTRLHLFTTSNADGLAIDGSDNPGLRLNSSGTSYGYVGMVTTANSWMSGTNPGDIVVRAEGYTGSHLHLGTYNGGVTYANLVLAPGNISTFNGSVGVVSSTALGAVPKGNFAVSMNNDDELVVYSPHDNMLAVQTALDGNPLGTYGGGNNVLALQPLVGVVSIGTAGAPNCNGVTVTCKLSVEGSVAAQEVVVTSTGWADYVFDSDYRNRSLPEVAAYIEENHHLPGIPSAAEVAEKGVNLGDMQARLLAKVEELTLHMIAADEQNRKLDQENRDLIERVKRLEAARN